ncbi:MAG: transposase [Methylococcales bacterium]|nr:transposase [Methylococcales bacterium]
MITRLSIWVQARLAALKIYGEGEWKVRQHGMGKRRTWRKVHLAVDGHARDVIGVEITIVDWAVCEVFEGLVKQVEGELEQIDADDAYDTRQAYTVAAARETRLVVPPRENAVPWEEGHPRNAVLEKVAQRGMAGWKKESGYHRRSIAALNVMTYLGMPVSVRAGTILP